MLWKLHEIIASIHGRRLAASSLAVSRLVPIQVIFNEEVTEEGGRKGRWNRTKVTAIYRNICLRLQVVRRHLHSHSHRHNLTQLSVRLHVVTPSPPHHGRLSRPALRFTSTAWVDFLNELSPALGTRHSTLGYEINDFSANFQQFAFWPRPGTARQPHQQIESRRKLFD